jgi:hypothetical protein
MLELKFSLKDSLKVKQLQYILTEDVDYRMPKSEGVEILTPELARLYEKIKFYS